MALTEIEAQLTLADERSLIPEILRYYQEILTYLAKKYPPTLEVLLMQQGIRTPDTLSIELTLLLRMDLDLIPGLTEEQVPELIYYTSLFLFNHANADRSVLFFTYSGTEIPAVLNTLAQKYRASIQKDTLSPEQSMKATDVTFSAVLNTQLKEANLDLHPLLLSLICFENCEPLRNLFIMIWEQQGFKVSGNKTTPLKPSPNKFLLGESYYRGPSLLPFKISKHDLILLEKLIVLSQEVLSSKASKTSSPDQLLTVRKLLAAQRQGTPFFTPGPEITANRVEFDALKKQIEDPVLRKSLFIYTMAEFFPVKQINFSAITSFFIEHNSALTNPSLPTFQQLQQLFEVINKADALETVTLELEKTGLFIKLNSFNTLGSQIEGLNKSINKINTIMESFTQTPGNEEFELRMRWFETQKRIHTQWKEKASTQLEAWENIHNSFMP
ncbi:hypothetical protein TUM19329_24910 [Legionella antarctica]|uniref:Uncharacterized protein n=1 Tax=Legionella antarctica TaxID=2708020 RepID=A0A6F8T7L0_9GAMM|nr:hypothetical protein [Legionella antarctica]BCA96130.1 hypothetical protein TUM19329_24910 [Legionella antarctica]